MAKRKTSSEIRSQSWKDIQQLSKKELKEQINTLNAVVNKRIKRLQEKNLLSPATRELEYFRLKPTDTKQGLQKQLSQLTNFLDMKTSTIKGAKQYTKFTDNLAEKMNLSEDPRSREKVWELLEKYRETNPHVVQTGSKEIYEQIARISGEYNTSDIEEIERLRQSENTFEDDFNYFEEDEDNDEIIQFFMGR